MKKKWAVFIAVLALIGIVTGCSSKLDTFDDENIIFEVVDTLSNNESETIKITNQTGFDLENLSLAISNSEKETVEMIDGLRMKANETNNLSIPIDFYKNIDLVNLEIDFKGNVVEGLKEVPFNIVGSLKALVER